jgi:hypothetical protein
MEPDSIPIEWIKQQQDAHDHSYYGGGCQLLLERWSEQLKSSRAEKWAKRYNELCKREAPEEWEYMEFEDYNIPLQQVHIKAMAKLLEALDATRTGV